MLPIQTPVAAGADRCGRTCNQFPVRYCGPGGLRNGVRSERHSAGSEQTWLLDVSRGFEDVAERCSDQIDHGDEGMGVSVASCPGASGLEDTVERLHAGVAVG